LSQVKARIIMPTEAVGASAEDRMRKAIEVLRHDLAGIRTGRASPALLERVMVEYYGTPTPLTALATISVPEARLLMIQPWDRQTLGLIERAIQKSDLGLTPNNDGGVIRLAIPELTDERRRELVRLVQRRLEEARVAIRNCRRDALEALRKEEREKKISEDELRRGQEQLQKLTDRNVAQVDDVGKAKEKEILET
jgi:ribosome recycling factor